MPIEEFSRSHIGIVARRWGLVERPAVCVGTEDDDHLIGYTVGLT